MANRRTLQDPYSAMLVPKLIQHHWHRMWLIEQPSFDIECWMKSKHTVSPSVQLVLMVQHWKIGGYQLFEPVNFTSNAIADDLTFIEQIS